MKNDGLHHFVICRRIKKVARDKGIISKAKLSKLSGVSPKTIWNIWNERVEVSNDTIEKLAAALGVTADFLVTGNEAPARPVTPEPVVPTLGERAGSITMAEALQIIADQMGVPLDVIRQPVLKAVLDYEKPAKRKP